ncbi:hypothetical protein D6C78_11056 [Aureobasidium pullulans]|uniref:Uncharacterized protein n=1 Tax=Aureobasidium pullulans TaxID=5580 RepID=A0A4V4LCA6_AURPU|nr:hypothetical protein D6C78_11056 [Aureobasidium pullulans]
MMGGHVMNWLRNHRTSQPLDALGLSNGCQNPVRSPRVLPLAFLATLYGQFTYCMLVSQILVTIWWTTFVLALAVLLSLGFGTRGVTPG